MGYYTYHTLNWQFYPALENGDEVPPNYVQAFLDHLRESTDGYVSFDENGNPDDTWKWYDHNEDMLRVSKMFPNILFTLYGDGEDSDDNWVQWFLDGKTFCGKGELVYPEFDESKLIEGGGEL